MAESELNAAQARIKHMLNADTAGIPSITFDAATQTGALNANETGRTRIHLHCHRALVATLTDALLLRASFAYVEGEKRGVWKRLSQLPVHAVGFETDEALLNSRDHTGAPFPLLLEYFGFPDKFDLVDVDLAAAARHVDGIVGLEHEAVMRWMPVTPFPASREVSRFV
jgi:type VI secretion system protein ImpG